jgi:phosphoribosylglycinamide formyltransferase-1
MKRIIIFASGSGSNAENIIQQYHKKELDVVCVFCNNPKAGIIDRCARLNIDCRVFNKAEWNDSNSELYSQIRTTRSDLVVLAGFLWKVNDALLELFPNRIINIHPSLLPKYGGKGMYGSHVHEAVIENSEKESGITIHLVNSEYDKGVILFQKAVEIPNNCDPNQLASLIHDLEYAYFPKVVLEYLQKLNDSN